MTVTINNIIKTTVFPDVFIETVPLHNGLTIDPTLHANVVSLKDGSIHQTQSVNSTSNTSGKNI